MKRMISLVLLAASLFALPAMASTVQEQVAAPERAQGAWHSPSGRTTVQMDAEVIVPDVPSTPIVEAFPRIFEPGEAYRLSDALIGKGTWQAYIDMGSASQRIDDGPQPGYQDDVWSGTDLTHHALVLGGGGRRRYSLPAKTVHAMYTADGILGQAQVMVSMSYQYKQGENPGRKVGSQQDAVAQANAVVSSIWPDMRFQSVDNDMENLSDRISYEGNPEDYGYRIHFARQLHGVAVTPVSQQGAGDVNYFTPGMNETSYHLPLAYERLFVDAGEDGIFQLRYDNPLRIGNTLEDSPALLPFERILEIFGSVSPLMYAPFEQAGNNGIQVDRVALGYMNLQMKDHPDRYQMVPVWDFFGSRTIDREFYEDANLSLFTINAIDGTVIDRDLGY